MGINTLKDKLNRLFSEAIWLNTKQIDQNGIYLYIDSISKNSTYIDTCSVSILVASNTLCGDSKSALEITGSLRERLFVPNNEFDKDGFVSIKLINSNGSLFVYELKFETAL